MERAGKSNNAQWQAERTAFESHIAELQTVITHLEANGSRCRQEIESQNQTVAQLQKELGEVIVLYGQSVKKIEALTENKLAMEKEFQDNMATIVTLDLANQRQIEECNNLNIQRDDAVKEISYLEHKLETEAKSVAELTQKIAELQASMENHQVQCSEEKTAQESTIVDLQRKLEISVKEALEIKETLESLNQHLTELQDKHEKLQASYEQALADVKTLSEHKLLNEKAIESHKANILEMQSTSKNQLDLYSNLECENKRLDQDKSDLQTQLQEQADCMEELTQKLHFMENAVESNRAQWHTERTALESDVAELQTAVSNFEASGSCDKQKIESLNQTVAQLQTEHDQLEVSYEQSVKEIQTLTENKLAMEKAIEDDMATISTLDSANQRQIEEINNLNSQRDEAMKEISNLKSKHEREVESVKEMTQKVVELETSIESHKVKCSEEKTAQESTIVDLQRKLDISVKEALEKDQTVDSLNQHLTDIQDKHEKLQASYEKTLQTCSELQKEKDQAGLHQLESLLHTHKMQSEQLLQAKLQNKEIELPLKQGNTQQQKTIDELQNDNSRLATAWKTMQEKCVSLEKANKELKQKLSGYNEIMEILDRYRVSSCSDCSLCLQYK